jgi:hypothetical protein
VPFSDSWSLLVGLQGGWLLREDAHDEHEAEAEPDEVELPPEREYLAGADVTVKWKPTNQVDTYAWVTLTAEVAARRPRYQNTWMSGAYVQVVAQVARRWRVGTRLDLWAFGGLPGEPEAEREWDLSGSLAFLPSEFSRVRLTVRHDHPLEAEFRNTFFILQFEAAIGAHGAHTF